MNEFIHVVFNWLFDKVEDVLVEFFNELKLHQLQFNKIEIIVVVTCVMEEDMLEKGAKLNCYSHELPSICLLSQ